MVLEVSEGKAVSRLREANPRVIGAGTRECFKPLAVLRGSWISENGVGENRGGESHGACACRSVRCVVRHGLVRILRKKLLALRIGVGIGDAWL